MKTMTSGFIDLYPGDMDLFESAGAATDGEWCADRLIIQ